MYTFSLISQKKLYERRVLGKLDREIEYYNYALMI